MFKVIHKETGEIATAFGTFGLYFMLWDAHTEEFRFDLIANYKPLTEQPKEGGNV